jgi:hypothetical protein
MASTFVRHTPPEALYGYATRQPEGQSSDAIRRLDHESFSRGTVLCRTKVDHFLANSKRRRRITKFYRRESVIRAGGHG